MGLTETNSRLHPATRTGPGILGMLRSLLLEPIKLGAAVSRYIILNWPNTPFGMALRERYMRLRVPQVGRNFKVFRGCDFSGYELMRIGDDSSFAENCVVALGPGDHVLRIGNDTHIGPDSYFRNMNHSFDDDNTPILQQPHKGTDIVIGNGVWTGARCVFLAGTKIGDHCVIAAGSVVSCEIPPYSIAAGNPVRVVKKRGGAK